MYLLVLVYLYTLAQKVMDLGAFHERLVKNSLFSDQFIDALIYLVPLAELVVVVLVLVPKTRSFGLQSSLFMMIAFTFYLWFLNKHGDISNCGCGGIFHYMTYVQHMLTNFGIILVNLGSFILYYFGTKGKQGELNTSIA